jgi:hypothetical protein
MLIRTLGSVALAYVSVIVITVVLLVTPGTPHRRSLEAMALLESFRDSPEAPAAGAAFDEWLRIGRQMQWVDATLVPVAAALIVAAASRRRGRLAVTELFAVVLGFASVHLWRTGPGYLDPLSLMAPCVFGAALWLGTNWNRASNATARAA